MCPGMTHPQGDLNTDFTKDEYVAIYAEGKEHAMAIGKALMSRDQMYSSIPFLLSHALSRSRILKPNVNLLHAHVAHLLKKGRETRKKRGKRGKEGRKGRKGRKKSTRLFFPSIFP